MERTRGVTEVVLRVDEEKVKLLHGASFGVRLVQIESF